MFNQPENELNSSPNTLSIPHKIVNWLFRKNNLSLQIYEWMQLLTATMLFTNRNLLEEFSNVLLDKIAHAVDDAKLSVHKKELILYHALSYLAFSDPKENTIINIQNIPYVLERIQLTSPWISAPYYAFGLRAIGEPPYGQSILIFCGTTFPTYHGFLAGFLANTSPNGMIGSQLYSRGKKALQKWIKTEHERTNKRVMCTGQSLGGAMSLLCHVHQPSLVDVFAINPPSLTKREHRIYLKNKKDNENDVSVLKVISHVSDPVFNLGNNYLPAGTQVYRHGAYQDNWFNAHAKTPLCDYESTEPLYQEHINQHKRNLVWKSVRTILYVGIIFLHLMVLPWRFVIQIKKEASHLLRLKLSPSKNTPNSAITGDEQEMNIQKSTLVYTSPTFREKDNKSARIPLFGSPVLKEEAKVTAQKIQSTP